MPTQFYTNLQRRIRSTLPADLQTVGDFHLFCFLSCSVFFMALLTPWLAWLGLASVAWATGISAALCGLIGLLRVWGLTLALASQMYQTTLLVTVLYGSWQMNGLSSPTMVWLGIVPLLPWFTLSRRWTYFWLSLAFCSVWAFMLMHHIGWLPVKPGLTEDDIWLNATMYAMLCVTQGILLITLDTADADKMHVMEMVAHQLSEVNAKLVVTSRHKDQFLAMVSHAMRTPLNGVKGYLGLLADRQELGHDAHAEVMGAQNAASHLMTVINDLLDLSQISQGRFSLNPQVIQLHNGLRDIFRTLESHARHQGLTYQLSIAPDVPVWVKIDPDRVAQILINLLGNAIKFTAQGSVTLSVSMQSQNEQQAMLQFDVIDTGSGIEASNLNRIFEPFYQTQYPALRPNDDSQRGNGLGLAISRGLAQAMGGQLTASSQEGSGSCFTLVVPMALAQAPAHATPNVLDEALVPDPRPYHILVVDDQAVNRMVLTATLKKMLPHADVVQADGGIPALQLLDEQDFDLVLIDLIMPDLDGIEVARRTRHFKVPHRRDVPFIAITANVAPQAMADCTAAGIAQVMPKPFHRQGLLRAIQTHARPAQIKDVVTSP